MTPQGLQDDKGKPPRSICSRLFRVLFIAALCLLTLVCLAAALVGTIGNRRLVAAKDAAADKGLALTMADYLARLPHIPDSENAALIYLDAFQKLDAIGVGPESPYVPIVSLGGPDTTDKKRTRARKTVDQIERDARTPLLDYMLEGSIVYVDNRAEVLALLHEAASLYKSRYPIDWQGPDTLLPHHLKARESARLLGVAAWVDAEEGRPSQAASRIHDLLALARSLQGEPVLMSSLVEMGIISMSVFHLQRVVSRTDVSRDDILSLEEDLRRILSVFSLRPVYEGELASTVDMCENLLAGRYPPPTGSAPASPTLPRPVAILLSVPLKGYLRADEALAIRFFLHSLDNVDSPSPEFLAGPDPVMDEIDNSKFILCRMLLYGVSGGIAQGECTRARLRSTIAGLAALRYYDDHSSWPATLDTLVPDYIDAVPVDPFTGKALIYALKDDGIIIYSVGSNGIDDGEGYYTSPAEGVKRTGDDVGFRIWK